MEVTRSNLQAVLANKYEVQKRLGKGDHGEVFLVERIADGELFACKTCYRSDEGEFKEARLWAKLDLLEHRRYVAQLHEVFPLPHYLGPTLEPSGHGVGMVIDYFPVGSLLDVICAYKVRGMAIPVGFAWSVFCDVCEGLRDCHEHGIVHGDVDTCNILLRMEPGQDPTQCYPQAAVSDLGFGKDKISFEAGDHTAANATGETPQRNCEDYLATEAQIDLAQLAKIFSRIAPVAFLPSSIQWLIEEIRGYRVPTSSGVCALLKYDLAGAMPSGQPFEPLESWVFGDPE